MKLQCHYWGQESFVLNLGDALVPLILGYLGYECVAAGTPDAINAGRTLLVIGSLLNDSDLDRIEGPIDIWGCGWRGQPISAHNRTRLRFHAVRGPMSVRGLELAPDTPVGDPGLLMPRIISSPAQRHGARLVLPHCLRLNKSPPMRRLRESGADRLLSPWVIRTPISVRPAAIAQAGRRIAAARRLPATVKSAVRAIAGARFVLTGSLHGAILSHAYGVPWAAYDDHGIDAPAKWQDLAALLQTDIALARDIRTGEAWWDRTGQWAARPDGSGLLAAFPFAAA